MRNLLLLFVLVFSFNALAQTANQQSAAQSASDRDRNQTSTSGLLPPVGDLKSVNDLVEFHKRVEKAERELLRAAAKNPQELCGQWSELVAYRFNLYTISSTVMAPLDRSDPKKLGERIDAVTRNVIRAKELYSEADDKCSQADKTTGKFLFAKFANAWLEDNTQTVRPSSKEQMLNLDESAGRVFADFDSLLTAYRDGTDKSWIDINLLLYSYANSLLKQAQIERAEPLLTECLKLASAKYGENSVALLPVLRLLSGIAYTAEDQTLFKGYQERIEKITVGSGTDARIVFDLRTRAEPDSIEALFPERPIVVFGRADEVAGRTNRPLPDDHVGDLPAPAGQRNFSSAVIAMTASTSRRVKILITVSDTGNVVDADLPKTQDERSDANLKQTVMSLKFRPLIYNGHPTAMKGYIYLYVRYSLAGKPSPVPPK